MKEMWRSIVKILDDTRAMMSGFLASILGFFFPIKDIVHLILVFFIIDVLFGYWAAKKTRKEKFSVQIIWTHTMPRILLSVIIIILTYLWDSVFAQNMVHTYMIAGWFICGVLLSSIIENGWKITRWTIFPKIGKMVDKEMKDKIKTK